jgi:hypothetical protein
MLKLMKFLLSAEILNIFLHKNNLEISSATISLRLKSTNFRWTNLPLKYAACIHVSMFFPSLFSSMHGILLVSMMLEATN